MDQKGCQDLPRQSLEPIILVMYVGGSMVTLYRTPDCPGCLAIQSVLKELVLAHHVVVADPSDLPAALPQGTHLPVLVDEGVIYQGREAILAHLEELESFKELWDKFQSDACYCDEEGNVE